MWELTKHAGRFGKNKWEEGRIWICFLWLAAVLVNIKSIFTDYGVDNAYALATSYRHVLGDRMFLEMWEPHQTSSFLVDFLLKLYRVFIPSLEGAAFYLQICGVILYGIVTYALFRWLSKIVPKNLAHLVCVFCFAARAKQTVFPEFSNMQIAFSIMAVIFLCSYVYEKKSIFYLIMASFFLCLEAISYPSCVIAVIPVVFWLYKTSYKRVRDIPIFVIMCILIWGGVHGVLCRQTWRDRSFY